MIIVRDIEEFRHVIRMGRFINNPRWSPRELYLLRLYRHLPDVEIAEIVGRNEAAVKNKRRKIGLRKRVVQKWTPAETVVLRRCATRGLGACRKALPHRHVNVIMHTAKRLNIVIKPAALAKTRHLIVDEIRERAWEDGISLGALDREIGARCPYFGATTAINQSSRVRADYVARALDFFGARIVNGKIDWMDK